MALTATATYGFKPAASAVMDVTVGGAMGVSYLTGNGDVLSEGF